MPHPDTNTWAAPELWIKVEKAFLVAAYGWNSYRALAVVGREAGFNFRKGQCLNALMPVPSLAAIDLLHFANQLQPIIKSTKNE